MNVAALQTKLHHAEHNGTLPKVFVPVHLTGSSCDMAAIGGLAERYGFAVLEDASHAIGGLYHGEPVGKCRHSAITVFSFHPVKIITTGEGGLATTKDPVLAQRMAERNLQLQRYRELLADLPVRLLEVPEGVLSSVHLAVVRLQQATAEQHRQVFEGLRAAGIGVQLHYSPVHLQPYYRATG